MEKEQREKNNGKYSKNKKGIGNVAEISRQQNLHRENMLVADIHVSLRAEAIKWLKDDSENISDWKSNFRDFHNITEEDLADNRPKGRDNRQRMRESRSPEGDDVCMNRHPTFDYKKFKAKTPGIPAKEVEDE